VEVWVLAKHGEGAREIARELGVSRNTVRRYLREPAASRYSARPPRASKLELHKRYIVERLTAAAADVIPASDYSPNAGRGARLAGASRTDWQVSR